MQNHQPSRRRRSVRLALAGLATTGLGLALTVGPPAAQQASAAKPLTVNNVTVSTLTTICFKIDGPDPESCQENIPHLKRATFELPDNFESGTLYVRSLTGTREGSMHLGRGEIVNGQESNYDITLAPNQVQRYRICHVPTGSCTS